MWPQRKLLFRFTFFPAILLVFSFVSCKEGAQPWESFGDIVSETRILRDVQEVELNGKMICYLTQDTAKEESIVLQFGSNVLKGVISAVEEGKLTVTDHNKGRWLRNLDTQLVCTLNVHQLRKLQINHNVKLICLDTISSPRLEIGMMSTEKQFLKLNCGELFGGMKQTGTVVMEGRGVIFSWSCERDGRLDARNLVSDDVYIWNFTKHDVWVNPNKQFEAYTFNKGNIFYFVDPVFKFKKQELGEGKVIKE